MLNNMSQMGVEKNTSRVLTGSHDSTLPLWMSHCFHSILHPDLWSYFNMKIPSCLWWLTWARIPPLRIRATPKSLERAVCPVNKTEARISNNSTMMIFLQCDLNLVHLCNEMIKYLTPSEEQNRQTCHLCKNFLCMFFGWCSDIWTVYFCVTCICCNGSLILPVSPYSKYSNFNPRLWWNDVVFKPCHCVFMLLWRNPPVPWKCCCRSKVSCCTSVSWQSESLMTQSNVSQVDFGISTSIAFTVSHVEHSASASKCLFLVLNSKCKNTQPWQWTYLHIRPLVSNGRLYMQSVTHQETICASWHWIRKTTCSIPSASGSQDKSHLGSISFWVLRFPPTCS